MDAQSIYCVCRRYIKAKLKLVSQSTHSIDVSNLASHRNCYGLYIAGASEFSRPLPPRGGRFLTALLESRGLRHISTSLSAVSARIPHTMRSYGLTT